MSDDPWATRRRSNCCVRDFTAIKPEVITVTPADTGAAGIGHFGFFRPEHRDTLWRGAAEWIEAAGKASIVLHRGTGAGRHERSSDQR